MRELGYIIRRWWNTTLSADGDDLDVLQEIWATDDRFVDADDVEVIPLVGEFPIRRPSTRH